MERPRPITVDDLEARPGSPSIMVVQADPSSDGVSSSPKGTYKFVNTFPHAKILDQTKLKAFSADKLNITKMMISVFD